ncbi:MAG: FlgD immunoglobulin-like domain containing protein [Candidatus Eisenbacteria bacterium]
MARQLETRRDTCASLIVAAAFPGLLLTLPEPPAARNLAPAFGASIPFRTVVATLGLMLLLLVPFAARAGTPCIEAVFFDLGDTLVENDGTGTFVLRAGAESTVQELKARGVRLGIITNVPATWDIDDLRALLAQPEFLDEFEVVILSSEAPAPKPDPAIYLFAHEALAEPRPAVTSTAFVGETLVEIGNHETDPTLGARSVGMIGIYLSDGAPSPLADYTIPRDALGDVVTIVDETCDAASLEEDAIDGAADQGIAGGAASIEVRPNPSAGTSRIGFRLEGEAHVRGSVFDAQGRLVADLFEGRLGNGAHELVWDGRSADGAPVPGGVYFARVVTPSATYRIRLVRAQ